MKKILFLFALLFSLIACKKDDQNNDADSGNLNEILIGEWKLVSAQYSGKAPNPLDSSQIIPYTGIGTNVNGYYNFSKDPDSCDYGMFFTGQFQFGQNTFQAPVEDVGHGIWSVPVTNDRIFYEDDNGDTATFHIVESTATRQVWDGNRIITTSNPVLHLPMYVKVELIKKK